MPTTITIYFLVINAYDIKRPYSLRIPGEPPHPAGGKMRRRERGMATEPHNAKAQV